MEIDKQPPTVGSVGDDSRVRNIFEQAGVGIAEIDRDGRFLRINSAFCVILGRSRDELLLLRFQDVTHPEDRAADIANVERLVRGEVSRYATDKRYVRNDGSPVWVRLTASAVRRADGSVEFLVAVVEDISARRDAEQALRHSEARMSSVIEALSEGLVIADPKGNIYHWNEAALRMHHFVSVAEVTRHLHQFVDIFEISELNGRVLPVADWPLGRILRGETLRGVELRIRRHDLDWQRILSYGGTLVRDADGKDVCAMVTIIDVTDRRRAEAGLAESEQRFRALVEASSQIVWTTDAHGSMREGSASWCAFTGQTREQASDGGAFDAVHVEDRENVRNIWGAALRSGNAAQWEMRVRRADGRWRWMFVRAVPLLNDDGSVRSWVGMNADVTERRERQISLEQEKYAAEADSRAKDHFLAVVSHELRTPLTPVLATVSHLCESKDLPVTLRDELEMIRRNIEIEAQLVDDLLNLTRIQRGKVVIHHEAVDVHAMIRSLVAQFERQIDAKHLNVSLSLGAADNSVWADPTRLQQVLFNLFNNALKFTPDGGTIQWRTSCDGARFNIALADDGIGIEPDVMRRLFNPFEQGERTVTRKFGGLGLGLSIARQIVELHGGKLTAESDGAGKGAVFNIELKAAPAVDAPTAAKDASSSAAPVVPERRVGASVLLVEDHPDTLRTLRRVLEHLGYEVRTAASVAGAMKEAESRVFDLLISDIGLPDGSGLDVVRALRQRKAVRQAITLSGFGHTEDIERSREAGFAEHLVKPVDLETLRQAVERALTAAV